MESENTVQTGAGGSTNMLKPPAKKEIAWDRFSVRVKKHIREYVVVQYGDLPDPMLSKMKLSDMAHDVDRYNGRLESNVRGEEEVKRDLIKIAHYASLMLMKIEGEI